MNKIMSLWTPPDCTITFYMLHTLHINNIFIYFYAFLLFIRIWLRFWYVPRNQTPLFGFLRVSLLPKFKWLISFDKRFHFGHLKTLLWSHFWCINLAAWIECKYWIINTEVPNRPPIRYWPYQNMSENTSQKCQNI